MNSTCLKTNIVIFRIDILFFAFSMEETKEIIHLPELIEPPAMASMLKGFVNIEQRAVPVILLSKLFELKTNKPGLYSPLIIVRTAGNLIGILADEMIGVKEVLPGELLEIAPEKVLNECVSGTIKMDNRQIHLLDLEKILLKQEKAALSIFARNIESRLKNIKEKGCQTVV